MEEDLQTQLAKELGTLHDQIAELNARVAELERCKHENHTISADAVTSIAQMVMSQIVVKLQPQQEVL